MAYTVDYDTVSTVGLESSPVAAALAGLRANEARFVKNKWDHVFIVGPASKAKETIDWVHRILIEERDIVVSSREAEVEAGRNHSRFILRLQERVLTTRLPGREWED
jgi:hypothetical protein